MKPSNKNTHISKMSNFWTQLPVDPTPNIAGLVQPKKNYYQTKW